MGDKEDVGVVRTILFLVVKNPHFHFKLFIFHIGFIEGKYKSGVKGDELRFMKDLVKFCKYGI